MRSRWNRMWIIQDFAADRRRAVVAFLLSFLLLFSEFLGGSLLRSAMDERVALPGVGMVLLFAFGALALTTVAEPLLFRLMGVGWREGTADDPACHPNRVFAASWILTFLAWIPCFLAFYPGLYTYDIGWQWSMYEGEGYSTHHSLLHTWLSGTLFRLGRQFFGSWNEGLALYALFQLLILSGSVAFAVRWLVKIRAPKKVWVTAAAFYMLFPFFPIMGISTTKDVIYGALCLIVIVGLAEMTCGHALYRGWRLALFAIVMILMGLFRNNAVYGVLFVLIALAIACLHHAVRRKSNPLLLQITVLFLVCAAGIGGMNRVLIRVFDAYEGSVAEMLSVPCQQLARTWIYHGDEMTEEEKEQLFYYIPEVSLNGYTYYLSDPVKSGLNLIGVKEDPGGFVSLWARLGREYPAEYILSPLYNTMGLWYLTGDSSCYVDFGQAWIFDDAHVIEPDSRLPALQEAYRWFQNGNIRRTFPLVGMVFYTSFYAWALYFCLGTLFAEKRYLEMAGPLYLFAYVLTLALGPCIQIRYMFGTLLCAPVLLVVMSRKTGRADA